MLTLCGAVLFIALVIVLRVRRFISKRRQRRLCVEPTGLRHRTIEPAEMSEIRTPPFGSRNYTSTLRDFRYPLFIDTETTGLHSRDGIITLAMIRLDVENSSISHAHFIFDPLCKSHAEAEAIHKIDDWTVRHQPLFGEYISEIDKIIRSCDGIVCHNATFDIRFLRDAYQKYGAIFPDLPVDCTMLEARQRGEASSLSKCAGRIGLKRNSEAHGALEDALLCMKIWLAFKDLELDGIPDSLPEDFSNFSPVPEHPMILPRRSNKAKWDAYQRCLRLISEHEPS